MIRLDALRNTDSARRMVCTLGCCVAIFVAAQAAALEPAPKAPAAPAVPTLLASLPSVDGADLEGLLLTLDREYRLGAIYDRAAADFGARGAIAQGRRAHRQRLARLVRVYRSHGIAVPANPWTVRTPSFASREQACVAAFRGELELNTALADLASTTSRTELASAYKSFRDTSAGPWVEELRTCALSAG